MIVCGKNVVRELIRTGTMINKCYMTKEFSDDEILNNLYEVNVVYSDKRTLDRMAEHNQGIVVEIDDYKYTDLNDIINVSEQPFLVMLDHLEDPHNFGAIIRTCEAALVDGIIIPKDRSVEVTSTVMKTSSGALTNVSIAMVSNLVDTIDKLKKAGYWIIGLDMDGTDYEKIDYNMPTCLVIGSEGFGLKPLTKKKCDIISSIPMKGKVNSLNASVAAGIMIYQVLNKRR